MAKEYVVIEKELLKRYVFMAIDNPTLTTDELFDDVEIEVFSNTFPLQEAWDAAKEKSKVWDSKYQSDRIINKYDDLSDFLNTKENEGK